MATDILHGRKTVVNITEDFTIDAFTVDGFQILWGYDWVKNLGIHKSLLSNKKSKYHISRLSKSYSTVDKSLGFYRNVKVIGINIPYKTMNRQVFAEVLTSLIGLGHLILLPVLAALATEALEERAKEQLGIDLTSLKEKEENTQRVARQQGKLTRRSMTDSISSWCKRNNSEEKIKGYSIYCSDQINLHLFGKKSKQLREENNVKNNELLRDIFDSESLRKIQRIEDRVILLADMMNIKPTDAIKTVIKADQQQN